MNSEIDFIVGEIAHNSRRIFPDLVFNILEIGAVPIGNSLEPFHRLVNDFPGSTIHAFELDPSSFLELKNNIKPGVVLHNFAIGRKSETRTAYLTNHSMCSSLYEPNEAILCEFQNMEVAYLKNKTQVPTISVDELTSQGTINSIDFIKIDIQGAELDVFQGARLSLKNTLAIVTEVEFFEHYKNQPLFGDVYTELASQDFMFHKFIDLSGRALKPIVINGDIDFPSWHLWSDAMFVRHLYLWENLEPILLLKLAILSLLYNSPDVAHRCLKLCDAKINTTFTELLY